MRSNSQHMAQSASVWRAPFSPSGNMQIDNTFVAHWFVSELAYRSVFTCPSFLPLTLRTFHRLNCVQLGVLCPFPQYRTKEYLPSAIFKGFSFPFGFVIQQTTSSLTQLPNCLNSLWHPNGDLCPVPAPLVPLSHTCSHLKWCHQAVVNSWHQLLDGI